MVVMVEVVVVEGCDTEKAARPEYHRRPAYP